MFVHRYVRKIGPWLEVQKFKNGISWLEPSSEKCQKVDPPFFNVRGGLLSSKTTNG